MTDPTPQQMRELADVLDGYHSWNDEAEAADALRTAADEVDRLRTELQARDERTGMEIGFRHILEQKYTRLRAAIENAPHEMSHDHPCYAGMLAFAKCTCWKADALPHPSTP